MRSYVPKHSSLISDSAEITRAFLEAEDIATQAGQRMSSAHLLLALFTFPNRAQALLEERNLNEDKVLEQIRIIEDEPRRTMLRVRDRAREIATGVAAPEVDCLHLLIALTRHRDAFAYKLLHRTGTSLTSLRNIAVGYITGGVPRRLRNASLAQQAPATWVSRRSVEAPRVIEREPTPLARPAPAPSAATPDPEALDLEEQDELDEFDELGEAMEAAERVTLEAFERAKPVARPAVQGSPASGKSGAEPERLPLQKLAPTLAACGFDLVEQARAGNLDTVIGRDRELDALIDILGKRRANNPIMVGPPGVGKTAIVEGLAVRIAREDDEVAHLHNTYVVSLDTGALVAGTSLRGAFSEKMGAIKSEVARAGRQIVVFIDEFHTMIGAGTSGEGSQDAANELKAALARGEFPCIGATTEDEFKKHVEKDPALERRFTPISVEEPSPDEAILILEGSVGMYAGHHGVEFSMEAVHAAVRLSHRFITERQLPDKAFAVIDLAGSRARRQGQKLIERIDIARVVHEWSGVPLERLAESDTDRFARAEEIIAEQLIGHDHVVQSVARAVRRGFAGFSANRPIASFLFLGPTGVGKTELVKILAEFLFGRRDALVRVDMSEYSEAHSVSRLIGAQPGYVGYEQGGQLTEALRRRPFQIVLFDEVEKAHRDVLNVLLQVLDEGHLTDSRGRRVSFANTLIVLTSNLGSGKAPGQTRSMGFGGGSNTSAAQDAREAVVDAARGELAPELWGRLDERAVFDALSVEQVSKIAELQLRESARSLFAEREITVQWSDRVLEYLLDAGGYSPRTGARGMRQTIQREVEGPIASEILSGTLPAGARVRLDVRKRDGQEKLRLRIKP